MSDRGSPLTPTGAWPVVLTPFTAEGSVDHTALTRYADWLIERGADGLFAVALSGEMYELSRTERVEVTRTVVSAATGRVPVAAAALGDDGSLASEAAELAAAGADIVVLVVSAILSETDDEERLHEVATTVIAADPTVVLGLYECPLPHHRLLTLEALERLARTGRFVLLKETSHDVEVMRERVRVGAPHGLHVFNAGIENYAQSLAVGVSGLSGWIVNVAPDAVSRLGERARADGATPAVLSLQDALTDAERAMAPSYPSSAKAIVNHRAATGMGVGSRWRPAEVDPALVEEISIALDRLP